MIHNYQRNGFLEDWGLHSHTFSYTDILYPQESHTFAIFVKSVMTTLAWKAFLLKDIGLTVQDDPAGEPRGTVIGRFRFIYIHHTTCKTLSLECVFF